MHPKQSLQDPSKVRELFSAISGRYDLANHVLSGLLDFGWRRHVACLVATRAPRDILDLATGSGDLALELQRRNPGARVVGADFCVPMLSQARRKGAGPLVAADGLRLPFRSESFDALTVAFGLRNMSDWNRAAEDMRRVLRPQGAAFILDFSMPEGVFAIPYRFYLHRILPALAAVLTGRRDAYEYLGQSIEDFPRGRAMCRLLESAGFITARASPLAFGIVTLYVAERTADSRCAGQKATLAS